MRLITATVPPNCDIALHGDIHRGNVASSLSGLQETFDWIMDKPDRRFVMMGDAIEAITTDDKRFHSGSTNEQIPMRQATAMVREYEAVKGRGLAWLSGNHEFMLHRVGDFGYAMAGNLGIPYGGRACRLTLQDKRGPFAKMYLIHPSRWTIRSRAKDFEQRQANLKASVKQFMVDKASDCVVMAVGHTHRLLVVQPSKKLIIYEDAHRLRGGYLDGDNSMPRCIDPDRRWYVNTGSYFRTQVLDEDVYSECAGYDPVELGFAVVSIRDRKVVSVEARFVD